MNNAKQVAEAIESILDVRNFLTAELLPSVIKEAISGASLGIIQAAPVESFIALKDPTITMPEMAPRSGKWPRLERIHLADHPFCEVCGTKEEVVGHHMLPFHLFPEHELDPDNIISLCNSRLHHILVGHGMNFKDYNPDVKKDAAHLKKMIATRLSGVPEKQLMGGKLKEGIAQESEFLCDSLFLAHPEIQ
jgi:5-methylcytosine-specific restriction enzyme A